MGRHPARHGNCRRMLGGDEKPPADPVPSTLPAAVHCPLLSVCGFCCCCCSLPCAPARSSTLARGRRMPAWAPQWAAGAIITCRSGKVRATRLTHWRYCALLLDDASCLVPGRSTSTSTCTAGRRSCTRPLAQTKRKGASSCHSGCHSRSLTLTLTPSVLGFPSWSPPLPLSVILCTALAYGSLPLAVTSFFVRALLPGPIGTIMQRTAERPQQHGPHCAPVLLGGHGTSCSDRGCPGAAAANARHRRSCSRHACIMASLPLPPCPPSLHQRPPRCCDRADGRTGLPLPLLPPLLPPLPPPCPRPCGWPGEPGGSVGSC